MRIIPCKFQAYSIKINENIKVSVHLSSQTRENTDKVPLSIAVSVMRTITFK